MVCLDRLLDELGALVGLMKDADAAALPGLLAAAFEMTPAKSCLLATSDKFEIPKALRTPIAGIRNKLAQATALERSGQFRQGLAVAEAALADSEPLRHDPTTATALLQVGRLQWRAGDPNAARETLIRATTMAETSGMKELRVQSLIELVWVSAWELRNPEEGGVWGRLAEASLRAEKVPSRSLVAELQEHMGGVYYYKDQFAEGVDSVNKALAVWKQDLGPKHPAVAYADNKVAVLYLAKGDLDEALAHIKEAIAIYTEETKGHHPGLVFAENNLGSILMKMGDLEGAQAHFETALRLGTTALGANHAEVAVSYANLGAVAAQREDYPKAIEHLEHALEIERSRLGDHHLSVSDSEENLATVYELAGQNAKARVHCEAALAIRREKLGAEHDSVKQTAARCDGL
jgi:eukaryotic-like serine/threonine-protein kinase